MATTPLLTRTARPVRREAASHLFAIGQTVRLRGEFGRPTWSTDVYRITGTLPVRDGSPQYRIRNGAESHERVTTQDSLELVRAPVPGEGAVLMERTFGISIEAAKPRRTGK